VASIYKRTDRKGKPWRAKWQEFPGGPFRYRYFAKKSDAERFLDGIRGDLVSGTYVDPRHARQRFLAFADEWAASQDWKATSRESWQVARARLVPLLGAAPLGSIDLLKLQAARQALSRRYARSTTATTMSYAGAIMRAAHAAGRIGRDPTRGLRAPKARAEDADGRVGPDQVPTRAEALAILEGAPRHFRAAVALGLAGLRVGEVLGMAADRLELEQRQVVIDQQLQRIGGELVLTTPKAEKARTIIVPGLVAVELRRHLRDVRSEGLLFRGARGALMRRDEFYSSAWKPALRGAGLADDRFVFHSLRHFCASTLLAEGAPLSAVGGHLGDTVERVSRTYVHWLRDDREVPAEVLDRVLAPAPRSHWGPSRASG
jgi:integrase